MDLNFKWSVRSKVSRFIDSYWMKTSILGTIIYVVKCQVEESSWMQNVQWAKHTVFLKPSPVLWFNFIKHFLSNRVLNIGNDLSVDVSRIKLRAKQRDRTTLYSFVSNRRRTPAVVGQKYRTVDVSSLQNYPS